MPNGPETFSLGSLTFVARNFGVPEDLVFATTTMGGVEAIPQSAGIPAQKASQTFGVVTDTIKFEAWFIGQDAETDVQTLLAMQLAQTVVTFTRGMTVFDVVIYHVERRYHSANEIGYAVELEPLSFHTSAGASAASVPTVSDNLSAVNALLANAPADTRLATPTIAAQEATAALYGQFPNNQAPLPAVNNAIIKIVAAIDLLQALGASLSLSTDPTDISTYLFAAECAGALSVLVASMGSVTGASSSTVLPGSMNLYQIAVKYLGDISAADTIIAANPHITDPFNLGTLPIAIPGL